MKKRVFVLVSLITLLIPALTFGSDNGIVKLQGWVMNVDLKQGMFVANEKSFFWDQQTMIHNEKGEPTTFDKLKAKSWVYVEGYYDKDHKTIEARRIYLLPKRIHEKEKHLFPFLE